MANALYDSFKEALLEGWLDLLGESVVVMLIDSSGYRYAARHSVLSHVPPEARVATSYPLERKSVAGGVFDADDAVLEAEPGAHADALILYMQRSREEESPLIAYIDQGVTGLPVAGDGQLVSESRVGVVQLYIRDLQRRRPPRKRHAPGICLGRVYICLIPAFPVVPTPI